MTVPAESRRETPGEKFPRQRPRTCVQCRKESPKRALIRVVRLSAEPGPGQIVLDERGKLPGRGAYLCARRECLEKARKSNALGRALKAEIPGDLYDRLKEYIETYREKRGEADIQRELRALLGLSRRAALLHIGIDSVKSRCGDSREKEPLLILTVSDSSEPVKDAVRRQVENAERQHVHLATPLNVAALSAAIGASGVQVVALPGRNGLADKIKMLLS
jgi:predicted RNA-binding protein YlxR (DUF448 family)